MWLGDPPIVHPPSKTPLKAERGFQTQPEEAMMMKILPLFFMLLVSMGHYGYAEPQHLTRGDFTFGLPFYATQSDPCPKYPDGLCLADSFPLFGCYEVALISNTGVCRARTSYRYHYEVPGGSAFEATVLEVPEDCQYGSVAVVADRPEAVSLIPLEANQPPAPKDVETRARGLLEDWMTNASKSLERTGDVGNNPLSTSPPMVLKAAQVTILRFQLNEGMEGWKKDRGPVVLSLNDQLFRLEGWCTDDHLFFSANEKLHLAYTLWCCGCGERILYVYDLSGKIPKKVYENDKLSN